MARAFARATAAALKVEKAEDSAARRSFFDAPQWVVELAGSLEFQKLLSFDFRRSAHINVNETMAYRTFVKYASRSMPDSRLAMLLDSRVALGCQAKGRSSGPALTGHS